MRVLQPRADAMSVTMRGDPVPSPLLVSAYLSRNPDVRRTVDDVAEGVGRHIHRSVVHGALRRQHSLGLVSADMVRSKRATYYVTQAQAREIQAELREVAHGFARWLLVPAAAAIPPMLPATSTLVPPTLSDPILSSVTPLHAAKPAPRVPGMVLGAEDPAVVASRLTYLYRMRDKTIFGDDAMLKAIIADYEATLVQANRAA